MGLAASVPDRDEYRPDNDISGYHKRVEFKFALFYIRRAYDQNRFGVCTSEAFLRWDWVRVRAEGAQKPQVAAGFGIEIALLLFSNNKPTDIEKDVVHVR